MGHQTWNAPVFTRQAHQASPRPQSPRRPGCPLVLESPSAPGTLGKGTRVFLFRKEAGCSEAGGRAYLSTGVFSAQATGPAPSRPGRGSEWPGVRVGMGRSGIQDPADWVLSKDVENQFKQKQTILAKPRVRGLSSVCEPSGGNFVCSLPVGNFQLLLLLLFLTYFY